MSFQNADNNCSFRCWAIGAGVGLLGMLLLWMGPSHFLGALAWGLILAVVTGLVLSYLLCRGDADEGHAEYGAAAGAATSAAAAGAAAREDSGVGSFDAAGDADAHGSGAASAREDSGDRSFTPADAADLSDSSAREDSGATSFDAVGDTASDLASDAADAASDAAETVKDSASDAADAVADAADDALTSGREDSGVTSFDAVGDAASDLVSDAADAASDVAETVKDSASDAVDAVATAADEAAREDSGAASFGGEDYDGDGIIEGENEGSRPEALSAPRAGGADDLKKIKGVGPKMETMLHELGFYHFDQIAGWSADEVAWVDANLKGFRGRVSRDNWVEQATLLAKGGETEFSKKVDKGGVY